MPSSIRSKRKPNRQKLTIAITDLHSSTNQPSVAKNDQETLLREHNFSYMFACTGSFQQPSVRHAMPITRSTRFLTEAGRRDASLIFLHAWTGASYWPSDFRCCFFHDRPSSRSALHAAESTGTSTCSEQRGKAIQKVHIVWMGGSRRCTDASAKLYAKSYMLRRSKYRSLANACSFRVREQLPTGSNNRCDRQRSEHKNEFVRY